MPAVGLLLLIVAGLLVYEVVKGGVLPAQAATDKQNNGGGSNPSGAVFPSVGAGSPGATPPSITANTTGSLTDYLRSILPVAQAHSARTGIPVAYYLGIIANESSPASRQANALFGIQGSGFPYTDYHANGQPYQSALQSNPSVDAAFQGFDNLITQGRYAPAYQQFQRDHNVFGFFTGINNAGYSETPTWPQIITNRANEVRQALGIP